MKKHEVLASLEEQLAGIDRAWTKRVGPMMFRGRILRRAEETKARAMVQAENILTAFADSNVPQLAFAVTHINDVPVESVFTPVTDDELKSCEANPQRWRAEQLATWLAERDTVVVEELWMAYLDAKDALSRSLDQLSDFSTRTPSGS